jgi:transposase
VGGAFEEEHHVVREAARCLAPNLPGRPAYRTDSRQLHHRATSEPVERWQAENRKFRLVFQPTCSPWVNQIERLWKTVHDTVTRNHQRKSFEQLAQRII